MRCLASGQAGIVDNRNDNPATRSCVGAARVTCNTPGKKSTLWHLQKQTAWVVATNEQAGPMDRSC